MFCSIADYYVVENHNLPVSCFDRNLPRPIVILFPLVAGKDKLKVLGHETLAVSKIASACEKSARTGESVELTWGPDDLPPK